MMDVTSCGSMAGSACAAFRAVGPCILLVFFLDLRTSAVNDRGEMATGRGRFEPLPFPGTEPSSEKKKRTFDSVSKYQCTDDCTCIGPSIYCIRPSHASRWQRASKQI